MLEELECRICGSVIISDKEIKKCSCGSKEFVPHILSKSALLNYIKNKENEFGQEQEIFDVPIMVEDIEEETEIKKLLLRSYEDIRFIIGKYLDMDEDLKKIVTLWIIGTYFHKDFVSFPYLYLNAMKGSGKTRLMNLIAALSWKGSVQNSLTEAVIFRNEGTLCIDEFERAGRKGSENLLELLNSAYKKGAKVTRMKKKKVKDTEEFVMEEYNMYRPIAIANITGLDNVLQDRCMKIVLEKSVNVYKTRLIENLLEQRIKALKRIIQSISLSGCSLCNVVTPFYLYKEWNNHILQHQTTHTHTSLHTTLHTLTTLKDKFKLIEETKLNGRDLELSMPLLIIAMWIDGAYGMEGFFEDHLNILDRIFLEKKQDDFIENLDYSLYDFFSQELEVKYFQQIKDITHKFREFMQSNDEWINPKWMGRALSRLNLVKEKRRLSRGIEVVIDYKKAKEKANQFR